MPTLGCNHVFDLKNILLLNLSISLVSFNVCFCDFGSPLLWASVVLFLLVNVHGLYFNLTNSRLVLICSTQILIDCEYLYNLFSGWHASFWVSFLPLVVSIYLVSVRACMCTHAHVCFKRKKKGLIIDLLEGDSSCWNKASSNYN